MGAWGGASARGTRLTLTQSSDVCPEFAFIVCVCVWDLWVCVCVGGGGNMDVEGT